MGDFFQKLGDLDATAEEAPGLAASVLDWLVAQDIVSAELTKCALGGLGRRPGLCNASALRNPDDAGGVWTTQWPNGLQIEVRRQVYYGGQSGVSDAICPQCGSAETFNEFSTALDDWYERAVPDHACPVCSRRSLINEWKLDPQWGVGHLQLTFWNWPPLSERFNQAVAAHLNNHRLLYIRDKF